MPAIRDGYIPAASEGVDAEVVVGGITANGADFQSTIRFCTPAVFAFMLGLSFLMLVSCRWSLRSRPP